MIYIPPPLLFSLGDVKINFDNHNIIECFEIEYRQQGPKIADYVQHSTRTLNPVNSFCRCGNINWARRAECNVCNTQKYNKQEARTGNLNKMCIHGVLCSILAHHSQSSSIHSGLGGGFKERDDIVEYKEHNDDDDEYDEVCKETSL